MQYELAQELRDAGFPQTGRGTHTGPSDKLVWRAGDRVYIPTLEELIEACGDDFLGVSRIKNQEYYGAFSANGIMGRGRSHKEAVARLWLALQRESK